MADTVRNKYSYNGDESDVDDSVASAAAKVSTVTANGGVARSPNDFKLRAFGSVAHASSANADSRSFIIDALTSSPPFSDSLLLSMMPSSLKKRRTRQEILATMDLRELQVRVDSC